MKIPKLSPHFINQKTWDAMKKKEKAFVVLLYQRRYTKEEIMDRLFIDCERSYYRLKVKVRNIIQGQNVT